MHCVAQVIFNAVVLEGIHTPPPFPEGNGNFKGRGGLKGGNFRGGGGLLSEVFELF